MVVRLNCRLSGWFLKSFTQGDKGTGSAFGGNGSDCQPTWARKACKLTGSRSFEGIMVSVLDKPHEEAAHMAALQAIASCGGVGRFKLTSSKSKRC
jgi:hypothetical protein